MPEELSSLLERIQKEGVEKAEAQAEAILSEARQEAEQIRKDAQQKAQATREQAEQDAEAFQQRAAKTLEQSARDVVLSVGQAIDATFESLVKQKVATALTPDTLKDLLLTVVKAYAAQGEEEAKIDVLLPPDKQQEVLDLFTAEFQERLGEGIQIRADDSVISGFHVSMKNEKLEHDFSAQAISDALCQLLRPHLAEIVKHALDQ